MHKKNFGSADFFRSRTRTKIGFFVCAICTNKLNKNSRFCATCPIRALALLCGIVVAHITFALAAHYPSLSLSLGLSLSVSMSSWCVPLFSLCILLSSLCVYVFSVCVLCLSLTVCSLCACFVSLPVPCPSLSVRAFYPLSLYTAF